MKNFNELDCEQLYKYLKKLGYKVKMFLDPVNVVLIIDDYTRLFFEFNIRKELMSIWFGQWCNDCGMFTGEEHGGIKLNIKNKKDLKKFISFIEVDSE